MGQFVLSHYQVNFVSILLSENSIVQKNNKSNQKIVEISILFWQNSFKNINYKSKEGGTRLRQVYKFRIDENDEVYAKLKELSRIAKDLYNQALWEIKQHYRKTGKILSYEDLDKIMKTRENLEGKVNYRLLPAKVAQQVLKMVSQNVRAFFRALRDYKQNPEKYRACPRFPNFLPKAGHFVVVFTNQQATIGKDGKIKLTKEVGISIPENEFKKYSEYFIKTVSKKNKGKKNKKREKITPLFAQVRIVPKFRGVFFHVEIVYDKPEENANLDVNRTVGIDLGVNNLAAIVDSEMHKENRPPVIINGKPIKSVNQYYNKQKATLHKGLAKEDDTNSRQIIEISDIRNQKIEDYLHKASRFVIQYCLQYLIGHIVIGYNPEWKQSVNLGKRNNQNFVQIPFLRFIEFISYKAQLAGIKVTIQEESYTSKCSALDLEAIAKHEDHAYAGKRIKRGLFVSELGFRINADVNGALNILRKVIGDSFLSTFIQNLKKVARLIPSSGYLCYPLKVCF